MCAVDPRHRYPGEFDPYPILAHYMDQGCVGLGENVCGLPVDDPMQQRVYEACDRLGLAVVMHFDHWINRDRPGLAGFENMLATYRNVRFVGHAQYFWREISAQVDSAVDYPTGPVVPGGRLDELFVNYPNLYADLSAGSGCGAITRDPEFGVAFLERWKDRLMFGTDTVHTRPMEFCTILGNPPILEFLRSADLSADAFERITHRNAEQVYLL
jgi:predicted TIM-barrel fold metal-dependent hydrolase